MPRTDAKENLITAIEIASSYRDGVPEVPEVAVYFEYQLYRGNRTHKANADHFEALFLQIIRHWPKRRPPQV